MSVQIAGAAAATLPGGAPYGTQLRQTITSSGAVSVPAGITWCFAIVIGGGGSGGAYASGRAGGGGAGGVTMGWTPVPNTCTVGAGGTVNTLASGVGYNGGTTIFGGLVAGGGGGAGAGVVSYGYYFRNNGRTPNGAGAGMSSTEINPGNAASYGFWGEFVAQQGGNASTAPYNPNAGGYAYSGGGGSGAATSAVIATGGSCLFAGGGGGSGSANTNAGAGGNSSTFSGGAANTTNGTGGGGAGFLGAGAAGTTVGGAGGLGGGGGGGAATAANSGNGGAGCILLFY